MPAAAWEGVAQRYVRWADLEAAGMSPRYDEWARSLAADAEVVALVESLPRDRQQPNLVFASVRAVGVPTDPWPRGAVSAAAAGPCPGQGPSLRTNGALRVREDPICAHRTPGDH
ncbi:DUF2332 family protein [Litorihabitans aurantiacus]|uniref:Uncharacterized protein n=1 Tax=Litorihabitans aurantiacus TaxID=1930061 RepID=A0AA38CQ88_9MICO|nr:DUF2332 family protein [Litorihabitans aurantiacus]GMA32138.1 hypothetical protein GCM10025875_21300 [Litorihabitans aurantiacus]